MNIDSLIGGVIVIAFIVIILSKISGKTIGELLSEIKELFEDKAEDGMEALTIYE